MSIKPLSYHGFSLDFLVAGSNREKEGKRPGDITAWVLPADVSRQNGLRKYISWLLRRFQWRDNPVIVVVQWRLRLLFARQTPSTGLQHLSGRSEEGAGRRCSERALRPDSKPLHRHWTWPGARAPASDWSAEQFLIIMEICKAPTPSSKQKTN